MAAANSDQENVLLQSDEGSPSAPPPAGRIPFKARLAVGLCVFAAGLAGAVMMGRPAARAPFKIRWSAPTKIWHRWSAIGLNEHELKHMTKECVHLLHALAKEAEEEGRTHWVDSISGGTLDCKEESEQACTIDYTVEATPPSARRSAKMNITMAQCFPAVCKEANIFKELKEANIFEELKEVSCAPPGVLDTDFDPVGPYVGITKECGDLLVALKKEAKEEGRTHQTVKEWETLDCKGESEQACTIEHTENGFNMSLAACFPAVCKEENIFKMFEMSELSGLKVSCVDPK